MQQTLEEAVRKYADDKCQERECSFFMTKYSNEFKVKAIKMVLKGNSISHMR